MEHLSNDHEGHLNQYVNIMKPSNQFLNQCVDIEIKGIAVF